MTEQTWEDGSKEQQKYAVKTASVINTLDTKKMNMAHVADVLLAMDADLQIRDYALGLIDSERLDHFETTFKWLLGVAPDELKSAPATILAVVLYEKNDVKAASKALKEAREDYPLAQLLTRVMAAGWSIGGFAAMRKELHPKVCAGIFGEDA